MYDEHFYCQVYIVCIGFLQISVAGLEEDIMGYLSPELELKRTTVHTVYLLVMTCIQSDYKKNCFAVCQEVFTHLQVNQICP